MKTFAVLLLALISPELLAQCAHPQQDGTFIFTADTAAQCAGYWFVTASEYNAYLSAVEITVADVTVAFMWGMGTVVFFSFLAFKVRLGTTIVRKI
ncbi:MAG: hypothetical protein CVV11_00755 [Gammaproteobacteria bacterium HGW-Gammaproteobacteria-15]|nr:MAG: hypothetical protein CVV11_00755 [Gammaproteobacteria bacterium HGW-Gammaproteobacteria-15]